MRKLIMLIIALSLVIVQGHAQKRTIDSIDMNKMSEDLTLGLEDLSINLSDMQSDLSEISEMTTDSNFLKELGDMKFYTYNIDAQDTKTEIRIQRETERTKREAERAEKNNNYYAYSYSTTDSKQNNNGDAFDNIGDIKGVEVVYITKALLGMMPNMDMPGVNVGKVAGKLESLQIYSTEEKGPANVLKQSINKVVRSGNYETLMLVKDSDSKTAFYLKQGGKDKKSELLMVTEDGTDVSVIRMLGNFSIQDIQSLTKGQSIKK